MKVVVRGVKNQSGFGIAVIGLLKALEHSGIDYKYIPLNPYVGKSIDGMCQELSDYLDSISITDKDEFIKDSIFIDVGALSYGAVIPRPDNVIKHILYTTTETTFINAGYVEIYNKKFDEIWTASKFNKTGLWSSGVTVPIVVVPHVVDTDIFNIDLKPYKIKNKRKFNFIVNIDFSYRKGIHILLQSWLKAFNNQDDVSLIMKVSDYDFNDNVRPLKSMNSLLFKYDYCTQEHAPILVIPHMIDNTLIPNLYATGDVYIAPTLGEGFGFPIAEAMACGIPTITSDCSAPSEYVTASNGFLINLDEDTPVQEITTDPGLLLRDHNYKGRYIYNISVESLTQQLRAAYNMNSNALKEKGLRARNDIINMFSVETISKLLTSILED